MSAERNYRAAWHRGLSSCSDSVAVTRVETVTVPAAEWEAVLARLDTLERRVRDLRAEAA